MFTHTRSGRGWICHFLRTMMVWSARFRSGRGTLGVGPISCGTVFAPAPPPLRDRACVNACNDFCWSQFSARRRLRPPAHVWTYLYWPLSHYLALGNQFQCNFNKMPVRYNLSSVWVRLRIFSQLSIIQYVGLCVFSLPIPFVMIERIYILCLIMIIKPEVWTITLCLGLGHETMVCTVCLSIVLWYIFHTRMEDEDICRLKMAAISVVWASLC